MTVISPCEIKMLTKCLSRKYHQADQDTEHLKFLHNYSPKNKF